MNIYQIVLGRTVVDEINIIRNRPEAYKAFPQYEVCDRLMMGAEGFKATDFTHFAKVAEVATTNLEECFAIMNRWDDEDERRVNRLSPLHSLSVGDIVENDGKFFICDRFGFKEVYIPGWIADQVRL